MNKAETVKAISAETGFTQKDVTMVIETMLDTIVDTLKSGEDVSLTGFGKFSVTERSEREGRNPSTGEKITIAASKSPKFKAAKALKDIVNE